jgi:hypothetical protein
VPTHSTERATRSAICVEAAPTPSVPVALRSLAGALDAAVPVLTTIAFAGTTLLRALADRAEGIEGSSRIYIRDLKAACGVGEDWAWSRARAGQLPIYGPRGARYVKRAELERVLEVSTVFALARTIAPSRAKSTKKSPASRRA